MIYKSPCSEYVNDEKREKGILEIRKKVEETLLQNKSSFIRIEGFSGIGKTRFVYESLNDNKFKEFVLYVKSFKDSIFNDLVSFCKKQAQNSKELVVFVIDECSYDDHKLIYKHLNEYVNFVIITIDQVLSTQDKISCPEQH
jgi:hypothetical protein